MQTNDKTLKEARKLLQELDELEDAIDVLGNYDAKAYYLFSTGHNNNTKVTKRVSIPMSAEVLQEVKEEIKLRITEIKKKIEEL